MGLLPNGFFYARVVQLADTRGLGPRAERLVGSNPTSSTMHLSHCLNPSLLKALLFDKKLIIIR